MTIIQDLIHYAEGLSTDQWLMVLGAHLILIMLLIIAWRRAKRRNKSGQVSSMETVPATALEMGAVLMQAGEANSYHEEALQALRQDLQDWAASLRGSQPDPSLTALLRATEPALDDVIQHVARLDENNTHTIMAHLEEIQAKLAKLSQHHDRPASARHEATLMRLQALDQHFKGLSASLKESDKLLTHARALAQAKKSS